MKLSDQTIAHIAKILQVAILTGTDLVDNLRMVILEQDADGNLNLDPKYSEGFDKSVNDMLADIAEEQEKNLAEA